jgi:hypothetical protein
MAHALTPIKNDETNAQARPDAYALLWIDEQTFFTQRWRFVHPDVYNIMTSLVKGLHDDPGTWRWNPGVYWCPLPCRSNRSKEPVSRRGLAEKTRDPADRRRYTYRLSGDGRHLVELLGNIAAWGIKYLPGTKVMAGLKPPQG